MRFRKFWEIRDFREYFKSNFKGLSVAEIRAENNPGKFQEYFKSVF